jgi:hypothetical protein
MSLDFNFYLSADTSVEELHVARRAIEFLISQKSPFVPESADTATGAISRAEIDKAVAGVKVPNAPSSAPVPSIVAAPVPPTVPEVPTDTSINLAAVFAQNGPTTSPSVPPPAVPIPPANVVPPPPPAITPIVPTTDKAGLPWDARIHASTKTMTAEGVWKKKRGVLPEVAEEVEKEMRKIQALPAPGAAPAPGTPLPDFNAATLRMVTCIAAGKIKTADVDAVLASFGVETWGLLQARPDILAAVCTKLGV